LGSSSTQTLAATVYEVPRRLIVQPAPPGARPGIACSLLASVAGASWANGTERACSTTSRARWVAPSRARDEFEARSAPATMPTTASMPTSSTIAATSTSTIVKPAVDLRASDISFFIEPGGVA
jgi:hypothetical protein